MWIKLLLESWSRRMQKCKMEMLYIQNWCFINYNKYFMVVLQRHQYPWLKRSVIFHQLCWFTATRTKPNFQTLFVWYHILNLYFVSLGYLNLFQGICHCSDAYTGTSCTKLKSELNATLIEQTEWFPTSYFSNSSPTASVGHSLVAVGQNLWLYGGYHYDQGPLDQLWRLEI